MIRHQLYDVNDYYSQILVYLRNKFDDASFPFANMDRNASIEQELFEILDETSDKKEDTFLYTNPISSSNKEKSINSEYERSLLEMAVSANHEEYNRLIDKLTCDLEGALEEYQDESDSNNRVDDIIINIEHKFSFQIMGSVVQTIYKKFYNRPLFLIGICNSLMRYDLKEVDPWATVMLTGLINHPNEAVLEVVVQLIDNWRDKSLLPVLSTITVSSNWLRDYIDEVVKGLECEKCTT